MVLFAEDATSLHQVLGIRELAFSQREREYAAEELLEIVKSLLLLAESRNSIHFR